MTDPFAADDVLKVARRVLETEAEAVRALVDRLDERFERAVDPRRDVPRAAWS